MTNEHTISKGRREGKQTLKGCAPSFFHGAARIQSTDSRLHRSALNCTHLKKFVPSGTQHHVHVVGTMLAPQDALSKLQACSKYLVAKQHLATSAAICTLQVNLVAMSATHATNQVSTKCWLGTLPLRLRSTSVL